MIRQTIFGFKIEKTSGELTAHAGLALLAEYYHGMEIRNSQTSICRNRAATADISLRHL